MQTGLRDGEILGLHGFRDGSYNLGRREYKGRAWIKARFLTYWVV